jgi:hypothetical protein
MKNLQYPPRQGLGIIPIVSNMNGVTQNENRKEKTDQQRLWLE